MFQKIRVQENVVSDRYENPYGIFLGVHYRARKVVSILHFAEGGGGIFVGKRKERVKMRSVGNGSESD